MNEQISQRQFFNQKAEQWDDTCQHNPEKIEWILSVLQLQGSESILDVATGTGVLIPFYEKRLTTGRVVAFDCSDKMIEIARTKFPKEKHPQITFTVEDLYEIAYREEFDIAMCYSCFPHFPDKKQAVTRLASALKPHGTLVIAHSDSKETINRMHAEAEPVIHRDILPPIGHLERLMEDAGLEPYFRQDDSNYYIIAARKDTGRL